MEVLLREMGITCGEEAFIVRCSYTMMALSTVVCVLVAHVPGPYGRFSSPAWGPAVGAQLSWIVQECPSFIIPACIVLFTTCAQWHNPANRVLVMAFMLHYFQRSFIYPCLMRAGKPMPLVTHLLALATVTLNGYMQGRYHSQYAHYPNHYITSANVAVGLGLFTAGMFINLHSDHLLRNLRSPGEKGYKIPRGGLFQYVSCANYLGEVVEWSGYAVAAWSPPALAFALFTAANLVPRAITYHRNYQLKFDDYPKRKAIIPFIL